MKPYVWVVELRVEKPPRWVPTIGCGLTRADAQRELGISRTACPDDKFRLRKYVREEKRME